MELKVHHQADQSPPLVPSLIQINPVHQFHYHRPIYPLVFQRVYFLQISPPKRFMHLSSRPHVTRDASQKQNTILCDFKVCLQVYLSLELLHLLFSSAILFQSDEALKDSNESSTKEVSGLVRVSCDREDP
jgi:hypothetical protein